ncbi:TIGR03086 family metal-binding protein [Mycolicibacter sinensis]|uniref:TIGR03086 family metal-binding protein n=1 Tax=Mycolicibacter sinensis (strain JDM601) TaxID=875328 RepID=UPI0007EC16DF|nr:TIGR03086 family metal-binding protein [Mycolicibacter sinensis]OBH21600.1 TIGR03086 family protein [Mycolicibacter sinensis]
MAHDLRPGPDAPPTDELAGAEATLAVLAQVLHHIGSDELSNPTPCSEFDVAQLTEHLLGSITLLGGAAGAQFPAREATESPERQVIAAARPALDAWHGRGLDGTVTIGSNEFPARVAAGILAVEFLVHAWDYATATGRTVQVPEPLAEYVLGLAQAIITPEGRVRAGFDEPVAVPDSAPALQRLIAFTGRS